MFESIRRSDLPGLTREILRGNTNTRPIIRVIEKNGIKAVVKDFSLNRFFYRHIIGRLLIWRENKAYGQLKGLPGIPGCYRKLDKLVIIIEMVPGIDLESLGKGERLPKDFFDKLEKLVKMIHKRGMVHCDLKRAPNIILGDDGSPYIIDWSASISKREFGFFPLNLVYRRLIKDDLDAIIKMRLKFQPESVSHEEKLRYAHRSKTEKIIRNLRDRARDLLKKIA